jgi:hypothetical protein
MQVDKLRRLAPIPIEDIPPLRLANDEDPGDFVRRIRDAQ